MSCVLLKISLSHEENKKWCRHGIKDWRIPDGFIFLHLFTKRILEIIYEDGKSELYDER